MSVLQAPEMPRNFMPPMRRLCPPHDGAPVAAVARSPRKPAAFLIVSTMAVLVTGTPAADGKRGMDPSGAPLNWARALTSATCDLIAHTGQLAASSGQGKLPEPQMHLSVRSVPMAAMSDLDAGRSTDASEADGNETSSIIMLESSISL